MKTYPVGKTKYGGPGTAYFEYYHDGNIAIVVRGEDGLPLYKATVNCEDYHPKDNNSVLLKGWGGNEGVPEALVAAGIVELTGHVHPTGYVEAVEAKILVDHDVTT